MSDDFVASELCTLHYLQLPFGSAQGTADDPAVVSTLGRNPYFCQRRRLGMHGIMYVDS
jgi:hypothetical protein